MKLGVNIQVNFAWFPLNSTTARPASRARPHAGDLWSDAGACALCCAFSLTETLLNPSSRSAARRERRSSFSDKPSCHFLAHSAR